MKQGNLILLNVFLILLSGCSSTIFEEFSLDDKPTTSLSVDAKQRLLLVTDRGGPSKNERIVCAEPSPDAIMGIAASGALEASIAEQGSAKIATSLAEAIGELGQRTPTIQLLRDALYRACEANLNGKLSNDDYRDILYGYDDLVVTLLAIEGLTQRPRLTPTKIQPKEGKIGLNAESNAASEIKEQEISPIAQNLVSADVAKAVTTILEKYYELQKQLYK
jgi:hypothetical protein